MSTVAKAETRAGTGQIKWDELELIESPFNKPF
jgi:hypothetical protein